MKHIQAFLVCAVLVGCASTNGNDFTWVKNGASNYDFNTDQGQCRAQGFAVPGANLMQVVLVYENCMQGKGWYKVENR